jgi:hypothetical protein
MAPSHGLFFNLQRRKIYSISTVLCTGYNDLICGSLNTKNSYLGWHGLECTDANPIRSSPMLQDNFPILHDAALPEPTPLIAPD